MSREEDLRKWDKETSWHKRRALIYHTGSLLVDKMRYTGAKHPFIAIGIGSSALICALSSLQFAAADVSMRDYPVEEVSISIVPGEYDQDSALITGLTPQSRTGMQRVVAEIGCNGKGNITYTLLSGYAAPEGTTSEINTLLSSLPNPCETDFTITRDEGPQVLTIAEKVGLLNYQRS